MYRLTGSWKEQWSETTYGLFIVCSSSFSAMACAIELCPCEAREPRVEHTCARGSPAHVSDGTAERRAREHTMLAVSTKPTMRFARDAAIADHARPVGARAGRAHLVHNVGLVDALHRVDAAVELRADHEDAAIRTRAADREHLVRVRRDVLHRALPDLLAGECHPPSPFPPRP